MAVADTREGNSGANKTDPEPTGVLFVCLGNICRSPAAEAIFRRCVERRSLSSRFTIDSAGTIGYHEGEPADARMREAARKREVNITSISRPIGPGDFDSFDIIVAMDERNKADIVRARKMWKRGSSLDDNVVKLMCTYCKHHTEKDVPDPYYGGPSGFEKVLDILEDACEGLLDSLVEDVRAG